jgi:hypothetical protein
MAKHLRLTETDRGFLKANFVDANGKQCSIQQSSAIGDQEGAIDLPGSSFLWLGCDDARMHLSLEQVGELWRMMKRWENCGDLGNY